MVADSWASGIVADDGGIARMQNWGQWGMIQVVQKSWLWVVPGKAMQVMLGMRACTPAGKVLSEGVQIRRMAAGMNSATNHKAFSAGQPA